MNNSPATTNTFIVIPAYNEAEVIGGVIKKIRDLGFTNIIVIDDGSKDNTNKVAAKAGAICLTHKLNRGKGAATKTGIEAAKVLSANSVVTMDGDGQHDPNDINKLMRPIINKKCDVVLGSRLGQKQAMPFYKLIQNHIANFVTWLFYGLWVTDSQSGFRAYSQMAINVINTKADRYEYDSEVIREIKAYKLRYRELPIKVQYTAYSMNKQNKQGLVNGIKTLYKIIWNVLSF